MNDQSCLYEKASISSVQFSHSVVFDSLWLHELRHTRPPCPSPTPESTQTHVHWVSDAIQSSYPLSSPSPPALNFSQHQGQLFTSGGQSIRVSASTSVLPMNTQDWSPLEWLVGFPCSPRDSQESSLTPQFKSINSLVLSLLYSPTLTTIALTRQTFVGKVMSLLLNMLSRLIITFLPRSKRLLISWLQSPSAVILEPPYKIRKVLD